MDKGQFLLNALNQNHPNSVSEFLNYVEHIFGSGQLLDIHSFMCKKYGLPKIGTGRVAYISKSVVFKVPIDIDGFRLNDWEASLSSFQAGTPYEIPLAKSRHLLGVEIPIVVMEKVQELTLKEIESLFGYIPNFVHSVDMGQVGLNKKGNLVAFDYADL